LGNGPYLPETGGKRRAWMRKAILFACVFLTVIWQHDVIAADDDGLQQSKTGPAPPPGVAEKVRELGALSEVQLSSVPPYSWRHGCGPTAVGMVVGYYDTEGCSDLIPGDASSQTDAVNQAIASGGDSSNPNPPGSEEHYEDYSRPEDSFSNLLTDDYITQGRPAHSDNCIADYMDTSKSTRSNYYGQSWSSDVGPSFVSYVNQQNPGYGPSYQQYQMGSTLTWSVLTTEIDNDRPMVFLVDTDADGGTDHFVTIVGYRDTPSQQYGCLDTWPPADVVRWCDFEQMSGGQPWGIWGGWSFSLEEIPSGDSYEPDDSYSQANEILSGSPQNHSIVPATDEDWVWFSLSEESEVVIETSGASADTRMWLYDSSLNQIEYDDDRGSGLFSRIDRICGVDALSGGVYYVKIDEYNNDDEIPSYDITLMVNGCTGNPGELQFSNAAYSIRENGGVATITVIRTGGSDGSVTVDYASSDGTAIVDYDYLSSTGTLGFADGESNKDFSVVILDDNLIEDDETISLSLSNPTGGATLGSQDTAVLTIIDNEPDLNNDGIVNCRDYSVLARHWKDTCTEPDWCEGADFDTNSVVDIYDVNVLCKHWLGLRYEVLYNISLNTDPGWTTEGEWAFGLPTGSGGTHNGNPDPTSGFTGTNVYGVNLNGDYSIAVGGPYYLIAGPFDCSGCSYVYLKFARWLNCDCPPYVRGKIEASNNGADWQTIWEQSNGQTITDSDWQIMEYNISAVADNQPTVYIRWSYEIISDEAYPYSGWNIDDIQLWGIR